MSADWKNNSYDSIFVIVVYLTKMVYYESVKVIIDAPGLAEVLINVVIQHHSLPDCIISKHRAIFMTKFWSLLCSFLGIKWRLSTIFYPQTDRETEQQNSIIKAYLCAFVNWEQNDWVRFLLMAKFAYNNSKNADMGHTPFKLNCSYYFCVSFKNKCNTRSRSSSAKRLAMELRELMNVCYQNFLHA